MVVRPKWGNLGSRLRIGKYISLVFPDIAAPPGGMWTELGGSWMHQDGLNGVGRPLFRKSEHKMVIISCGIFNAWASGLCAEVFHNDPANSTPRRLNLSL